MRLLKALSLSLLSSTTIVAAWDEMSYQERDLYVRDPYPSAYADPEASYPNRYVSSHSPRKGVGFQERNLKVRNAYPSAYADAEVPYLGSRFPERELSVRAAHPSAFADAEVPYSDRFLLPRTPMAYPKPVEPVASTPKITNYRR